MRRGLADPGGFAMIFKQDPAAALDKTRAKLSSVEDNIASLRAKRAEVCSRRMPAPSSR